MKYLDLTGLQKFWNKCKSAFVTKDEDGDVTVTGKATVKGGLDVMGESSIFRNDIIMQGGNVEITNAQYLKLYNEDDSKSATLECSDDGELLLDGKAVATKDDIPSDSNFVTKDENGDIVVHHVTTEDGIDCEGTIMVKEGYTVNFCSEDNSKKTSLRCDDNGKLTLDGKEVATVDDIPSGGSIGDTIRGIKEIEFDNQSGNIRVDEDGLEVMSQYELRLNGSLGIEVESTGHIGIISSTEGISINSKNTTIDGVSSLQTINEGIGQAGQVLTTNGETVYWGNASGGDSSIIDLGAQGSHKDAQQAIVDHLTQMNAEDGCYLFKYCCSCFGNACFAVVRLVNDEAISMWGTVYDNRRSFREFYYNSDDGFAFDGCWLQISSFNEELPYSFETENKDVIGAINELNSKIGSGGGAGLSMPRIRLANWEYITPAVMINRYPLKFEGEIKFSICVQDGVVQEGDELEICALRKTYGKYKLRQFSKKVITAEDIENLDKQPYLQITTGVKDFFRTDSAMEWNKKPKYIRIRRPIYKEDVEEPVSAIFSNVVPVDIGLSYTQ
jgi:hypothetical protein